MEQFNMNGGNQNQRQVFSNSGLSRPIVGRKLPDVDGPTFQINQEKPMISYNSASSTSSAGTAYSNKKYSTSSTSTGSVMTPARSFQSTATASHSMAVMAPPNSYQKMAAASSFASKPIQYGQDGNQRENRNAASTSSSLGLMGPPAAANKSAPKPATLTKTQAESQVENASNRSKKSGESEAEKLRIFTGTVERVIKFGKILKNQLCYFQVMGSVVSISDGKVAFEKTMLLRDPNMGPILQVNYYSNSTHINIEDFHLGQNLRIVGRMIGPNLMSAFSIRAATHEEMESLPRLCYISENSISALCGEKKQGINSGVRLILSELKDDDTVDRSSCALSFEVSYLITWSCHLFAHRGLTELHQC